jgi:hypothetical protein
MEPNRHFYTTGHQDCLGYDEMKNSVRRIVSSMGGPVLHLHTAASTRELDRAGQTKNASGNEGALAIFEGLAVMAAMYVAFHYPTIAMYALCSLGLLLIYGIIVTALLENGTMSTACRFLRLLYTAAFFMVVVVGTFIVWS